MGEHGGAANEPGHDTRRLGRTGAVVGPISFGGASIAGLHSPVSQEQAAATINEALACGMRYVDTAPHYGAGASESRIGAALADRPRDEFVVSTKVGRRLRPLRPGEQHEPAAFLAELPNRREWDWTRDGIRRTLEASLSRLGLDAVDAVYLHDPDEFEGAVYATAFDALAELRDEGLVRAIGAGMNQTAMLTRFVGRLDLDVVLCAGRYSLLDRSAEIDLLQACRDHDVSVIVGGVFNSGLLADPQPGARFDYEVASPELVDHAVRLRDVCAGHGVSLTAAALQFPLRHPAVATVLVGCRTPDEVRANTAAMDEDIPDGLWDDIDALVAAWARA